jgi:hypothetical protein
MEFEALAEKEDFSLIEGMIDEAAFFRFNDGDFIGRAAIRAAFERLGVAIPRSRRLAFTLPTSSCWPLISAVHLRLTRTTGKVPRGCRNSLSVGAAPASLFRVLPAFALFTNT